MGSQTPFSRKMGVARVPRTRDPGPGLAWNSGQTGSDPVGKTRPSRSIFRDSRKMDRRGRVPISRKWGPGPPRPPRPDPPGPSPGLTLPTLRVRPRPHPPGQASRATRPGPARSRSPSSPINRVFGQKRDLLSYSGLRPPRPRDPSSSINSENTRKKSILEPSMRGV